MNPRFSKQALSFTFCLIALFLLTSGTANGGQRLKIVIDASKDGGLWWFPQAGSFDSTLPHQGKQFADSLRRSGAEVIELARGDVITSAKLSEADIVIRVPAFFRYTPEEAIAYRGSVAGGTRLLLIGGAYQDSVAEGFGLRFEDRTRFSSVSRWVRHPFTEKVGEAPALAWSRIISAPPEAVSLAWLGRTSQKPVLGYLPYGNGYVIFVGQSLNLRTPDTSFAGGLINAFIRNSPRDLAQIPSWELELAQPLFGTPPELIEPLRDATLSQPGRGQWRFDWEDIPKAIKYQIVVLGPSAATPMIYTVTKASELTLGKAEPADWDPNAGYIANHNLQGWSWRVRAQFAEGSWGPWSKVRRFNVMPR